LTALTIKYRETSPDTLPQLVDSDDGNGLAE
jgi:hypothetical protein